jgi:hypothetical protein
VVAIQQVVRQQLLAALHEEVGQQFKAQLITLTEERDAARNGRAGAEPLLVPLGVGKLIGHAGVAYTLAACKQLDGYLRGNLS